MCISCEGLVPDELENGDADASSEGTKLQDLPPCWGLDIVCGKGTDFNYGPWADRQRFVHTQMHLHKYILAYYNHALALYLMNILLVLSPQGQSLEVLPACRLSANESE